MIFTLWLADRVVAIPDQLDEHIVGFGPRVGEIHLAHRHRRELDQARGQGNA
jgi:hypothetical protein